MLESDQTPIWTALSHPKRRQIIALLQEGPRTTTALCTLFDVSRFAVMKHIKVLEQAGLVRTHKAGRQRWNRLAPEAAHFLPPSMRPPEMESDHATAVTAVQVITFAHQWELATTRHRAYTAWAHDVDTWWPWRHQDNSTMLLEAEVNGRFTETFPGGGGIQLGTITTLIPHTEIRLQGTLGVIDTSAWSEIRLRFMAESPTNTTIAISQQMIGDFSPVDSTHIQTRWQTLIRDHFLPFVTAING